MTTETTPEAAARREKTAALCGISCDADDAVFNAMPCTRAGLAAQLIFAAEYAAEHPGSDCLFQAAVKAAHLLDGPLVAKIGLSERLAEILSYEDHAA
jgi:hypothetical protein